MMLSRLNFLVGAAAASVLLAGCGSSETEAGAGTDLSAQAKAAAEASGYKADGKGGELHIYTWSDYIAPEVKRQLILDPPAPSLSTRQTEVLQSLNRGLTNRDIALQLDISVDRVEQLVKALLTKLGAANRTEAVAIALRKRLLKMA